ncbi:MAG TPA: hypothetical protein VM222_00480, partial [Planctomycetota bacterium]|nr:hypothetical protein [Planctomycetota bacterium]
MSFLFFILATLSAQQKAPDRELQGLAAKCGTEIPWLESLTDAQKQSKATGKPIAWWVTRIEGSPMDRKLVLEKYMLSGPFMMPGVIEFLSRDFVPLRLPGTPEIHKEFGLQVGDFIEPGFVFLGPDLKGIHRIDRLTTFNEEWLLHLFRGVLRKADRPVPPERKIETHEAWAALYQGNPDPALFQTLDDDAARWYQGAAYWLRGQTAEATAEWKKIKTGRWAWKAAAELSRDGPFVRGFEIY